MPIQSDNPSIVPATTYPSWWISNFTVNAGDPNAPVFVGATFVKITDRDANGLCEVLAGGDKTYTIPDLFALAASNPDVAALVDNLIATIGQLAKAAGAIE